MILSIRDEYNKQNAKFLGIFQNQVDENYLEIMEVIEVSDGAE